MKLLICLVTSIIILQILPLGELLGIDPSAQPKEDQDAILRSQGCIELVQNNIYTREELVVKVRYLVDDIELLKRLKDISRGYIYNSLNGWYIEARTPLSSDFDEWLKDIWNNADNYGHFKLEKQLKDLRKLKRFL